MRHPFKIHALQSAPFHALFDKTDAELDALGVVRMESDGASPCRVSLADAPSGSKIFLLNFVHHDVTSPYRAAGPIFVEAGAETAEFEVGQVPDMLRKRLLSVRGYDAVGMMVEATVVEGVELAATIQACYDQAYVSYLHIHFARPGCYACRVERAG